MGSGAETAEETVKYLNKQGRKVGVLNVRLYRPFSVEHFLKALPASVKTLAVLDRTKEPGSVGEPLYLDVVTAINEGACQWHKLPSKLHHVSSADVMAFPARNSPLPWSRASSTKWPKMHPRIISPLASMMMSPTPA